MLLRHEFEITEEARQLLLLALALMVSGPRPGFNLAASKAAEMLHGRGMYEHFKLLQEPLDEATDGK